MRSPAAATPSSLAVELRRRRRSARASRRARTAAGTAGTPGYRYWLCGSSSTIATVRSGAAPRARVHSARKLSTMRAASWSECDTRPTPAAATVSREAVAACRGSARQFEVDQQAARVGVDFDQLRASGRRGGSRSRARRRSSAAMRRAISGALPCRPVLRTRRSSARGDQARPCGPSPRLRRCADEDDAARHQSRRATRAAGCVAEVRAQLAPQLRADRPRCTGRPSFSRAASGRAAVSTHARVMARPRVRTSPCWR